MAKRRIKAVFFDLGETLLTFGRLDRNEVSNRAARRAYDYLVELNQPVGSYRTYRLFHLWGIRWNVLKSWLTGNDFDSLEVLKSFGRRNGINLSEDQWLELNWRWYESLVDFCKVVPGSIAALSRLKEMGLTLGLLSNTFVHRSSLERHMANESLLDFFPTRLYSYEYPWRKPDVRIFNTASEKIGIAPEEIVYVGDRIDFDVAGSARAGMLPILIKAYTNKNKTVPAGIECIKDNTELVDAILRNCEISTTKIETPAPQPVCEKG